MKLKVIFNLVMAIIIGLFIFTGCSAGGGSSGGGGGDGELNVSILSPTVKYYETTPTLDYIITGASIQTKIYLNDIEVVIGNGDSITGLSTGFNKIKVSCTDSNSNSVEKEIQFFINYQTLQYNYNFSTNTIQDLVADGFFVDPNYSIESQTLIGKEHINKDTTYITNKTIYCEYEISELSNKSGSWYELGLWGDNGSKWNRVAIEVWYGNINNPYTINFADCIEDGVGADAPVVYSSKPNYNLNSKLPFRISFFKKDNSWGGLILDNSDNILASCRVDTAPRFGYGNMKMIYLKTIPNYESGDFTKTRITKYKIYYQ